MDILWHQVPSVHPIPNSIPGDGVGGMESATTQDDLHHQLAANFARGQALIDKYKQQLDQEFQQQPTTNSFAHGSIAEEPSSYTTLHSLLSWSHDLYRWQAAMQRAKQAKQQRVTANMIGRGIKRRNGRRNTSNNERETEPTRALEASDEHPYSYAIALSDHWIATLQEHVMALMQQQQIRSMAHATRFPPVHWMTLTLLAGGIAISFLVATDQQEFLMQSLQVRILWSVLVGSFTSLAVLCFDLNRPFEGAYKIPSSRT
uniref:Uncharacterized protein n=1 Tax=Craspedostauros australis TaxID=1486917 RepID=A0A7R9ZSY0_9STRA